MKPFAKTMVVAMVALCMVVMAGFMALTASEPAVGGSNVTAYPVQPSESGRAGNKPGRNRVAPQPQAEPEPNVPDDEFAEPNADDGDAS